RDLRRERATRISLQGRQRDGANLQSPGGRTPSDRSLPSVWRHLRSRDGRPAYVFGRNDHRVQDHRDQTQCSDGACGKGQRGCAPNVDADRSRTRTGARAFADADQERGGAGGGLSVGNGGPRAWRRGGRVADVAAGYRRLSRPHHRNRFADAQAVGRRGRDGGAEGPPDADAQPRRAASRPRVGGWLSLRRVPCPARLKQVNASVLFVGLRIGGEAGTADAGRWWSLTVAVLLRWNASPPTSAL